MSTQPRIAAGTKYGRLTALEDGLNGRSRIEVQCECGTRKTVRVQHLLTGDTKSCGCLRREELANGRSTRLRHGHCTQGSRSTTYRSWEAMNSRCLYPTTQGFEHYGGRGIEVCESWRFGTENAFENFFADLGARPDGMALYRYDDDGDYTPENTTWRPHVDNIRNRRCRSTRSA